MSYGISIKKGTVYGHRHALYVVQRGRCLLCGARKLYDAMTEEHVIPRSMGGATHPTNIVLSCGPCNVEKGARPPDPRYAKLAAAISNTAINLAAAWARLAQIDAFHVGSGPDAVKWLESDAAIGGLVPAPSEETQVNGEQPRG